MHALARFLEWPYAPVPIFVAIWLLGFVGFERTRTDGIHVLDSAYRSLQMFGLNFDREPDWTISPLLHVARFLAVIFMAIAAIALFTRDFIDRMRLMLQCHDPKRRVLLGFGATNRAIANELRTEGRSCPVTAIDRSFSEADRRLARRRRILLLTGDLSAPETLDRARLQESAAIFVAAGEDAATIKIATAAARRVEAPHDRPAIGRAARSRVAADPSADPGRLTPSVHAHLSSVRLVADLKEARDTAYLRDRRFQPFSLRADAARTLFDRARLPARARDRGQRRVHLVIVGIGDQGGAVFAEALLNGYGVDLDPPKITFVDSDDAARSRLVALYPKVFDGKIPLEARPDVQDWIYADALTLRFEDDPRLSPLAAAADTPTAWVFACGDDTTNLAAALRLELAMQSLQRPPAAIFIRVRGGRIDADRPQPTEPLRFIQFFGDGTSTAGLSNVLDPAADDLPKLLHQFYRDAVAAARVEREGSGSPDQRRAYGKAHRAYDTAWDALPDNVRDSNRRAARHALVKLADLDLQWRGMDQGVLPRIDPDLVAATEKAAASPSTFETHDRNLTGDDLGFQLLRAAKVEHARWMADRALSGWQAGPLRTGEGGAVSYRREDRRRLHDNIKTFDELDARTRSYDIALIRALLHYLSGPKGNGRPLAFLRRTLVVNIPPEADEPPTRADFAPDVTELVVRITSEATSIETSQESALVAMVRAWSRRENAVRLQVRAECPLSAPLFKDFDHPDVAFARLVNRLHEAVGTEIVFDVTPMYA